MEEVPQERTASTEDGGQLPMLISVTAELLHFCYSFYNGPFNSA